MMQIVMIVAGIAIALLGRYVNKKQKVMEVSCTAQTAGKVVDIECRESVREEEDPVHPDDPMMRRKVTEIHYVPIYEFTINGTVKRKPSTVGSVHQTANIGQQVTVFYNPSDPEKYYVAEDKDGRNAGTVFVVVGAVIAAVGVILLFV